jgi:hypothetical protein
MQWPSTAKQWTCNLEIKAEVRFGGLSDSQPPRSQRWVLGPRPQGAISKARAAEPGHPGAAASNERKAGSPGDNSGGSTWQSERWGGGSRVPALTCHAARLGADWSPCPRALQILHLPCFFHPKPSGLCCSGNLSLSGMILTQTLRSSLRPAADKRQPASRKQMTSQARLPLPGAYRDVRAWRGRGGAGTRLCLCWGVKYNLPEPMGHSKGSPERKVYSHECIY